MLKPRFQYGGQAVIEGVMMRGRDCAAIAVRKPSGEISVDMREIDNSRRPAILKAPFIRGTVMLVESLVLGMNALMYSANESAEDEEQLSGGEVALSLVVALGLFVLLFIVLPNVIVAFIQKRISSLVLVNLIEGALRMAIFMVALWASRRCATFSECSRIMARNTRRLPRGRRAKRSLWTTRVVTARPMPAAARTSCS